MVRIVKRCSKSGWNINFNNSRTHAMPIFGTLLGSNQQQPLRASYTLLYNSVKREPQLHPQNMHTPWYHHMLQHQHCGVSSSNQELQAG
jgi:hypothetical protein